MASTEEATAMWDAQQSMASVLAAAEAGEPLMVSEVELRARLDALVSETMARGWSVAQRGEYQAICRALERLTAEAR